MNGTHPTAGQLDRYRRRTASPAELLEVDAHIASCDRCFAAVRADAHLTFDQMAAYTTRGEGRVLVERHIALCEMCRGDVNDLLSLREVMRPPRRRLQWLAAAAAILAFVIFAAWFYRRDAPQDAPPVVQTAQAPPPRADPPREIALKKPAIVNELVPEERVLRGGEPAKRAFALHAPIATVVLDQRPRFSWAAARDAESYGVIVQDVESSGVAASGSTRETSWQPDRPLMRGRTYAWQVTAHTGLESIVSPGLSAPEARFHVAPAEAVTEVEAQKTPLDRGVAMAEHGALDDAERELQRAADGGETRATSLLQQVRAWRTDVDYRLLPTTTNGAQ
jgi:hypothetical protein